MTEKLTLYLSFLAIKISRSWYTLLYRRLVLFRGRFYAIGWGLRIWRLHKEDGAEGIPTGRPQDGRDKDSRGRVESERRAAGEIDSDAEERRCETWDWSVDSRKNMGRNTNGCMVLGTTRELSVLIMQRLGSSSGPEQNTEHESEEEPLNVSEEEPYLYCKSEASRPSNDPWQL
ncbi:hypothetical protein Tco_0511789 [Tanacetum coccineum]